MCSFESDFKSLRFGVKTEEFDADFDEATTQLRSILRRVNDAIAYQYEIFSPIILTLEEILNNDDKKYPIIMNLTGKFPSVYELFNDEGL